MFYLGRRAIYKFGVNDILWPPPHDANLECDSTFRILKLCIEDVIFSMGTTRSQQLSLMEELRIRIVGLDVENKRIKLAYALASKPGESSGDSTRWHYYGESQFQAKGRAFRAELATQAVILMSSEAHLRAEKSTALALRASADAKEAIRMVRRVAGEVKGDLREVNAKLHLFDERLNTLANDGSERCPSLNASSS